jgi:hypothetical protein
LCTERLKRKQGSADVSRQYHGVALSFQLKKQKSEIASRRNGMSSEIGPQRSNQSNEKTVLLRMFVVIAKNMEEKSEH